MPVDFSSMTVDGIVTWLQGAGQSNADTIAALVAIDGKLRGAAPSADAWRTLLNAAQNVFAEAAAYRNRAANKSATAYEKDVQRLAAIAALEGIRTDPATPKAIRQKADDGKAEAEKRVAVVPED